jgi:hypothetical protein
MKEDIKIDRHGLRAAIVKIMAEGEVIDLEKYRQSQQPDPDQEWFDLFDEEDLEKYKAMGRLRQQTLQSPEQEAIDDETFEEYLQGIESGKVVDMFQDDDPMNEAQAPQKQPGDTAYPGGVGVGISIPKKDSGSGEAGGKCRTLRAEMMAAEQEYQSATEGPDKNAKQVAWEDLQHAHEKECGP